MVNKKSVKGKYKFLSMILGCLVLTVASYSSNSIALEPTNIYTVDNTYKVFIPDDYCDISETERGQETLKYLFEVLSSQPEKMVPHIVYTPCSQDISEAFPWGYIVTKSNPSLNITQSELNRELTKLFGDKEFMVELDGAIEEVTETAFDVMEEDFDIKLKDLNYGAIKVYKATPSNLHATMRMQVATENEVIEQIGLMSISKFEDQFLYYYLFIEADKLFDYRAWSAAVDRASMENKGAN